MCVGCVGERAGVCRGDIYHAKRGELHICDLQRLAKAKVESDHEEDEGREQSPEEHEALEMSLEKVIVADLPAHTARPQRKSLLPSKHR